MENFIQMMFDLSDVITYQEPTSGLSERRVRTSPLPDTEKVLKETEAPLSVKYSEQLVNSKKPIDPHGLSTKMLRECLAATEGMTSPPSSLKWSNWGMISNGKCLTQKISEYHKTGKESILLDILENGGVNIDTSCNQGTMVVKLESGEELNAVWYEKYQCYIAIRKLTPRECFRLQGWTDDYFEKAQFVNSDCQLYKQAGNGVTVDVVEEIGRAIAEVENEKGKEKEK